MGGSSANDNGCIYHLLSRSLGQGVAVAQIIDFNILDIIAVCDIDLGIQLGRTFNSRRRILVVLGRAFVLETTLDVIYDKRGSGRAITERIGGTSTCWIPFLAWSCALILAAAAARKSTKISNVLRSIYATCSHVPAAAAGSDTAGLGGASAPGL